MRTTVLIIKTNPTDRLRALASQLPWHTPASSQHREGPAVQNAMRNTNNQREALREEVRRETRGGQHRSDQRDRHRCLLGAEPAEPHARPSAAPAPRTASIPNRLARPGTSAGRDGEGSADGWLPRSHSCGAQITAQLAETASRQGSKRSPPACARGAGCHLCLGHPPTQPLRPLPLPNLSPTAIRAGSEAQVLASLPSGAATRAWNSQQPPPWVTSLSLPQEQSARRCFRCPISPPYPETQSSGRRQAPARSWAAAQRVPNIGALCQRAPGASCAREPTGALRNNIPCQEPSWSGACHRRGWTDNSLLWKARKPLPALPAPSPHPLTPRRHCLRTFLR